MSKNFLRVLGLMDAIAMVVGIMIASGIFLTAGAIAQSIESPSWILCAWLAGGIISATGALTMAQLVSLYPQAGGIYVYLREAFGDFVGFVYGWVLFTVLQCGSIAAIAIGFAHYLGKIIPSLSMENAFSLGSWELKAGQISAIVIIALLTILNYRGARLGSQVQNVLTAVKVACLLVFISFAFLQSAPQEVISSTNKIPSLTGFATALVAIMWTFAGWYNINFAAEEVKNPRRNIPLALVLGIALVTIIYILTNMVYLRTLSIVEIQKVEAIAFPVMEKLFGVESAVFLSLLVVISTLGALNGLIFASPRAYFAMARDGLFPGLSAQLHPRYQTPYKFIVLQGVWCSILVLNGSYYALMTYVMFLGLLLTALSGVALIVLRRRHPEREMFCSWGYPLFPAFFILSSLGLAANTFWFQQTESLWGLLFLGFAFPIYFYLRKEKTELLP